MSEQTNLALIIPCLNEEVTIAKVINDFQREFEQIKIFVIDNGSTDKTSEVAQAEGATIIYEANRGKGNALRRAFSDIDADVYLVVDGDDTYDPCFAPRMVKMLVEDKLDMVVAVRAPSSEKAYRGGHQFGNKAFNKLFKLLFGNKFSDIFSGYRVFSKAFVKSFPALSYGFEIETEICVHATNLRLATKEIVAPYHPRPIGSNSKLNTYKDGFKILVKLINLLRTSRPLLFYGCFGIVFTAYSLILLAPILLTFFETGLVPRFPTLIVTVGSLVISAIFLMIGVILQTMLSFQDENRRLFYLSLSRKFK